MPISASKKRYVKKTRAFKDCATGDWEIEFAFVSQDGKRARAIVAGDEAENVGMLRRKLSRKGAKLPKKLDEYRALLEEAIAAKPEKIVHRLANSGWQDVRSSPWLCVGHSLVGAPAGKVEYAPPAFVTRSSVKRFGSEGTLEEWQSKVAASALFSTPITVGICAAFGAPLLRLVGLQNFSLHLYGVSRAGKSTTLLCATSVYGYGDERRLPNWGGTGASILEIAPVFCDLVFPLNEVGAKKGGKLKAFEALRDLYVQYAEGGDRRRHSSWEGSRGGGPKSFHGICIATAEHSISEYATLARESRDEGELFRGIDVKAVREGQKTVLDLAPDTLNQRKSLKELRDALKVCHGTAFKPYAEFLRATPRTKLRRRVKSLLEIFVAAMPGIADDGIAEQMATNFGVLYAGGVLAIEAVVLPWTEHHLRAALLRAFTDAVDASKIIDPLIMGKDLLARKLASCVVERKKESSFGVKAFAGFWVVRGGVKAYMVHTRQFGAWFPTKTLRDVVLNWLCDQGLLKRAEGSLGLNVSSEDLKGVCRRWPNGKLVRSFVFSDPFSVSATEQEAAPTEDDGSDTFRAPQSALSKRPRKGLGVKLRQVKRDLRPKRTLKGAKRLTKAEVWKRNADRRKR